MLGRLCRSRGGSGSLWRLRDELWSGKRVRGRRVHVRKRSYTLRQCLRRHRVGPVELRRLQYAMSSRGRLRRFALHRELSAGERRLLGHSHRHRDGSGELRRLWESMRARLGVRQRSVPLSFRADVVQRRLRERFIGSDSLRRV